MANPNISDVKNKVQDAGAKAAEQVKDTASSLTDKAKDVASNVADRARDAASNVGQRAEDLTERAGAGVRHLGEAVRERGPHGGYVGSATSAVADTLERGGRYIEQEGLSGMADDLTTLIRKNPIPSLLIGIGLGFFLARLTRS